MNQLILEGCTPEPLMGYLKALGVLRLVCEQKDPEARGYWRDGVFVLDTVLGREELANYFLEQYSPTPLLAPWNGGSGFYIKLDLEHFLESQGKEVTFKSREVVDAINAIETSDIERLERYRSQIRETKRALGVLADRVDFTQALAEPLGKWPDASTKKSQKAVKDEATKILNTMMLFRSGEETFSIGKAAKDEFVSDLRGKVLTDDGLFWLDAALAMRTGQKKNRVEAPTLGSGGNIGNSDFSARFAQLVPEVMPLHAQKLIPDYSSALLRASLFGEPASNLQKISVDQFDPGKAGGANGTQGLEAAPFLNPWDYLLMMEGSLVLSGNTSRQLGAGRDAVSFPFVVDSSPAGHGSVGSDKTRGEAWLPLWSSPTSFHEVKFLLGEGRAEVGRTRAWSGLTFAQAVAGLGVDRGIQSFVRYEYQERLGQSYIATPVGRFDVPNAPVDGIELVRSLNSMLWSLQMVAGDDKAPARFATALRRIESAIFDFCKYGGANRLASILCALGAAERESSVGTFAQKPAKGSNRPRISPLGGLSAGWLTAADDGSHEFRLARGLTTIEPGINGTGAIRRYLEPVDLNPKFKSWEWGEGGGHVVWTGGSIARNLGAILTRRLMEAEKNGEPMPPLGSTFPVSLSAIAAFLDSEIDDAKLEDLIWGLALVERGEGTERRDNENDAILHRVYALTKLTLLPGRLEWVKGQGNGGTLRINSPKMGDAPGGVAVKPELAIPARLRGGDVKGACEVAARRLRASGFSLIAGFLPDGSRRDTDWSTAGVAAERLHAALLFPIPNNAVNQLSDLVLRRPPATTLV